MKNNRTMLERLFAVVLCLVMLVGIMPAGAFRVYAEETAEVAVGTVEATTEGLKVTGTEDEVLVENSGDAIVLEWARENSGIGRYTDGWWVGVKVTKPEGYAGGAMLNWHRHDGTETGAVSFDDSVDEDDKNAVTLFALITEEWALAEEDILYTCDLDWNNDGVNDQTVKLTIDPAKVVLLPKNVTSVECATEGLKAEYDEKNVEVSIEDAIVLEKVSADDSIGRYTDGWWAGVKITAPEYIELEDATFNCSRYKGENSLGVSFAENTDEKNGSYITMWALVTEEWVKNNETMEYQWDMFWDGTGIADMSVTMTLDPAKIILLDEDGDKVSPVYGSLTSSLVGTVTGANTDDTTLTVSGYEIPYNTEKNGWFVDVSVIEPLGCEEGKLGEENLAASTTYYLELKPEKANDQDRYENISGEISGTFTWDGVDQKMTLKAENMTLLKANQAALTFENSAIEDQLLYTGFPNSKLNSYTNKASGGTTNSAIVYSVSDDKIATVDQNGKVSFKKEGTVTITATKAGNMYYNDITASYQLNIVKSKWGLSFATSKPEKFVFGTNDNQFSNPASFQNWSGTSSDGIEYSILSSVPSGSDANAKVAELDQNGMLTICNVGTVTVQAKKAGNNAYQEAVVSYTLEIVPGTLELSFAEPETNITYSTVKENTYTYQVDGVKGTNPLTVTSSNEAVATAEVVDGAVIVTPHGSGSFILKASVASEDNYIGDEVEITIQVLTEQDKMAFEKPEDVTVTYNDNGNVYENPVVNDMGDGLLTYSSSAPLVAAVDTAGKVTIYKSGEVTITAEKQSNGIYAGKKLEYKLTINKDEQDVSLAETSKTVANDVGSHLIETVVGEHVAQNKNFGFAVLSKDDTMATTALLNNVISIGEGEYGTIQVTVSREGDDCYLPWSDTFTLNVTEMVVNTTNFRIGTAINAETGWYNQNVVITYEENGQAYNLAEYLKSQGKKHNHTSKMGSYTLMDGIYTDGDVVLCVFKGKAGAKHELNICANNALGTIKVDTKKPASTISYGKDVWGSVMEKLTFNHYDAGIQVTITATDNVSGIKEIKYKRIGLDEDFQTAAVNQSSDDAGKPASITFNVDPQYRGKIEFYAVDNAGLVEDTKVTATTIVVDSLDPTLAQTYDFDKPADVEGAAYNLVNDIYYTQYKTIANFAITEANFDLAEKPVVTVNGKKQNISWNGAGEAAVVLVGDGDYVLEVSFADKSKNEMAPYSQEFHIDTKAPQITLENLAGKCTKETIKTIVKIEEHNFDKDNSKITVTAVEADGNALDLPDLVIGDWKQTSDPDVWEAEVQLVNSGIYTLSVASADLAGNASSNQVANITVDKEAAQAVTVTYTEAVNFWQEILSDLTFNYYTYQEKVTVTVTATDKFSTLVGFAWTFKDEEGHVLSQSGKDLCALSLVEGSNTVYTGSFDIAAPSRGYVEVVVYDKANNDSAKAESTRINVVDNQNPGIVVTWPTAQRVVDKDNLDVSDYVYTTAASDCKLYYQGAAEATITISEANFFNGESVDGTDMKGVLVYDNGNPLTLKNSEWTAGEGDTWTNYVTVEGEGEHVLTVDYTDRSNNAMTQYVSNVIVIDETDPVVALNPDHNEERKYFNDPNGLTVELTVTETNFRASDVILEVVSVSEKGDAIEAMPKAGTTYAEFAKDEANWKYEDGKHILVVPFEKDANYTLDVSYTDLSQRETVADHSEFTLDRVAPYALDVSFSNNAVNPGYYGEAVQVTLSAKDDVAGIDHYEYSAGTASGTTDGGFTINPQFNGTVTFTAVDKAGNATELQDNERIVVDSIAPTCNVTFNAPYQTVGNVAYYAQNIQVTISITEANFFSNDVKVTVTKDGAPYGAKVTWNGSTGSIVLSEDGDYMVSVAYTDKSGNTMKPYTSQTLTRDTVTPVVKVSDIVANSANKNDPYSFEIEISDINLDPKTMEPVLSAVLKDEKGNYTNQEIALEDPETVTANETYRYTVKNLTEDALYSLTCTVLDMSGNRMSQILLEDAKLYDVVQFSINRKGSTFGYGDDYAEDLMNQYYVQDVDRDLVFVEINVDPIEDYVVTLNGQKLIEGVDYTTVQTTEPGEWSKREYIISKDLFDEDGEYSIVIHSTDKTNTAAYSDVKNLATSFVVDKTAPVITISGLESGGRYLTMEQIVTLIPTDEGGRLNSLKVLVMDADGLPLTDENGNDISVRFDMSGEELLAYLEANDGMITFTVPEGLNNQVQIICTDCAADILGQPNEYNQIFEKVTVSQNQLIIFFANKPLFYGVIAGVLGFLFLLLLLFKRKKDDEEEA